MIAAGFVFFPDTIEEAMLGDGLNGGLLGLGAADYLAAALWSLSLWFVSPLQLLVLFFGKIETERPSDWFMNAVGSLQGAPVKEIGYVHPSYIPALAVATCIATGTGISAALQWGLGDATWGVSTGIATCMAAGVYEVGRPTRLSSGEAVQLEESWQTFGAPPPHHLVSIVAPREAPPLQGDATPEVPTCMPCAWEPICWRGYGHHRVVVSPVAPGAHLDAVIYSNCASVPLECRGGLVYAHESHGPRTEECQARPCRCGSFSSCTGPVSNSCYGEQSSHSPLHQCLLGDSCKRVRHRRCMLPDRVSISNANSMLLSVQLALPRRGCKRVGGAMRARSGRPSKRSTPDSGWRRTR